MKIYGDRAEFFKQANDVINKWDWRHDNLNRYSNFFLKCKGLFKFFSFSIFDAWENKEKIFKNKWVSFYIAEELLIKRAHGYDQAFFFCIKVPDKSNSWGYTRKRVKFDYTELKKDLDDLVLWCDQKRAELYNLVSVDFMSVHDNDLGAINVSEGKPSGSEGGAPVCQLPVLLGKDKNEEMA